MCLQHHQMIFIILLHTERCLTCKQVNNFLDMQNMFPFSANIDIHILYLPMVLILDGNLEQVAHA